MVSLVHWKKFYWVMLLPQYRRLSVMNIVVCNKLFIFAFVLFQIQFSFSSFWLLFFWIILEKFSNSEENKVEYTELFQTYTTIIETTLDQQLTAKIPVSRTDITVYDYQTLWIIIVISMYWYFRVNLEPIRKINRNQIQNVVW